MGLPSESLLAKIDLAGRALNWDDTHEVWVLYAKVRASVLRELGPQEDIDDDVQNALAELWMASSRGRSPEWVRAWTAIVARRSALRRARSERSVPVDMTALAAVSHPAPDIAESVADEDHVLSLLRTLPPRERSAFALFIDGNRMDEIAGELRISTTAASRLVSDARARLRHVIVAQMRADQPAGRRIPGSEAAPARPNARDEEQDALSALPPRQREVLRLNREGYKPAQIAKVLSLSPNTVRVNLCHARKRVLRNPEAPGGQAKAS